MNSGQIVSCVVGALALGLFVAGTYQLRKAKQEQLIAEARDDLMAVADSVQRHPSGMQRLCPPPINPDDDPDFINSLRRQS